MRARFKLGEGMIGRAAASGEPYVSKTDDSDRFVRWVVETQGVSSFMHVPITLGGRLFGVLSAMHEVPGRFGETDLRRLASLGVGAAGAISHALEFEHERRIARALTRGYLPGPPDPQTGLELGLVYEPVAHQVGGGDVFGVWTQPSGAVALLIGDVSGKGLEVAAASAMVRFFVEARAWDSEHPAEVLAQANRILRMRLQRGGFATAFLAHRLRGPAALLQRGPPAAVPAAGRRRQRGAGGVRAAAGRRGGRPPRGARDRDRARRRPLRVDRRAARGAPRPRLLRRRAAAGAAGRVRPHAAAAGVRRARVRRGAGVGAGAPRRRRRARAAARAGARAARRARLRPGRAGAVQRVPGARARPARPGLRPRGGDLRHRPRVRGGARGVRRALLARPGRWAAAGCARSGPSWPRSSACS